MNREETKEVIKVMQLFVDKKEVETRARHALGEWMFTDNPDWDWDNYDYRLKPTPVLRPWTADEVPLGAWLRPKKDLSYRSLITSTGTDTSRNEWLKNNEHSTDGGLTWKPCGVEEVEP